MVYYIFIRKLIFPTVKTSQKFQNVTNYCEVHVIWYFISVYFSQTFSYFRLKRESCRPKRSVYFEHQLIIFLSYSILGRTFISLKIVRLNQLRTLNEYRTRLITRKNCISIERRYSAKFPFVRIIIFSAHVFGTRRRAGFLILLLM